MLKFRYSVSIYALPAYDDKQAVEPLSGETEAESQRQAKENAKSLAWDHCQQLQIKHGGLFGYQNVKVDLAPEEVEK